MSQQTAQQVLDRHYLEIRCGLLDLAAQFDRLDRSPGREQLDGDRRLELIADAIQIVASQTENRAEQLQLLFSDQYVPGWNRQ
ncbi:hypothetical protein [Planctomicrobium sp. SH664]|uniref:hypothetical protein n=1 Tax=Planctomicrobium sp. SH664 TaxID=3448125 RepID=UPI003F5C50D7